MNPVNLHIVICSTRPGRSGEAIATAVAHIARDDARFHVEVIDLADVNLPLFDESSHPMMGQYANEHTKRWAEIVARGDAFVFVMPEYNHSYNAALKNALDYLHAEWRYKPVGLVGYGAGMSMGARAAMAIKPVLSALKLIHTADVGVSTMMTPVVDGVLTPSDPFILGTKGMLEEINKTHHAIHPLRA